MSKIAWTCDECGKPIRDGAGYITVDHSEIAKHRNGERSWEAALERRRVEQGNTWVAVNLAELPDNPRAAWKVLHGTCDPNPDSSDYWIGVERLRTPGDVIGLSAHLFEKNWIQATTWASLLRGVAAQLRSAEVVAS